MAATRSAPLVSVVIPCFDQGHFLAEALESVLAQAHRPVEVVVVDDGSNDNTSAVARRYPGVRCIRTENRGLARARNLGLRESSGELLVFLDADDLLLEGAIEAGLQALEGHPECAFVFGGSRFSMSDGSTPPPPQRAAREADVYAQLLAGCPIVATSSVMYRRQVFDELGAFDPSISAAADYDVYYRVARARPVHNHGAEVAIYRRHGGNMTTNSRGMLRANVRAIRRQRRWIWRRPGYWTAYRRGVSYWQAHLGTQVAHQLQRDVQHRRYVRAARALVALVRYAPRTLLPLVRSGRRLLPVREWRPEAGPAGPPR
jgi:glycosyltransferase involved in cell wall biosynthesis